MITDTTEQPAAEEKSSEAGNMQFIVLHTGRLWQGPNFSAEIVWLLNYTVDHVLYFDCLEGKSCRDNMHCATSHCIGINYGLSSLVVDFS